MVLTVATVSSFSEYHNDGYQKNDQHGLGVSLVTYTVCNNCFVFVLKYMLPHMAISSYCAKILSLIYIQNSGSQFLSLNVVDMIIIQYLGHLIAIKIALPVPKNFKLVNLMTLELSQLE